MLSAQNIGIALYGLQGMSSEVAEVRAMLQALTAKVQGSTEMLSAQNIGIALYGLQGMSSDAAEVRAMLQALTAKVQGSTELLSPQNIGNALYGLCGPISRSSDDEEHETSAILTRVVAELDRVLGAPEFLSTSEKRDLMRSLLLFSRYTSGDSTDMSDRIAQLRAWLPTAQDESEYRVSSNSGGSRTEREIFMIAQRVLSNQPGCIVESNVWLDGCFEADIVITCVAPDGSMSVFNIEVDGPSHSQPTSQRLDQRRDQHLQEACGVRIARIPLLKPTGEWLRSGEYEAVAREVLQCWQLLLPE
jgi:hypothetical protein